MLQSLRKGAASWVAKIFLGLLVVSFAVWGIGDIFRGFGQRSVASIGSTEISTETFRQIYNQRLQALGRQVGRPVTAEQARALGLDRQMLGEVLAEAALDERAKQLRLGISDEELIRRIQETPAFRGPSGQFDRNQFDQLLRANGYTEPTYIAAERKLALRQQIVRAIGGTVEAPQALATLVDTYQNETRRVEFVTLGRAAAGDIATPADDVLKAYFEERRAAFRAPEYRKIIVLPVTVDTLAQWVEVKDADVRAYYDAHRDSFGSPEQRTLQQIVFPTAEEAKAAADKIAGGTRFEDVAAARGLKPADIDLGTVTRAGLLDPAVANAAFALAEGTVSAPVQGRFGHVLVRAVKVRPEQIRSLEDAADQIRRQIATDRAKRDLLDRHDKVEDERAAGLTLAEVAAKTGLTVETIEAVDRSGRDPEGAQITAFAGKDEVLQGAFRTEVRIENDPVQLGGNGFVWYEVAEITKARDRSFDEAREQVLARWQEEQAAERVKAKADGLVQRLKAGEPLDKAAQALGLAVSTVAEVRRAGAKELPEAAIAAVFATAPGSVASTPGEDAVSRLVIRVVEARVPDTAKTADSVQADLRRAIEDDLLAQYVAQLESELGVTVNRKVLDQIVGRDTGS